MVYRLQNYFYVSSLALLFSLSEPFGASSNADWPGLLGPTRNGLADINSSIPNEASGTPKQLWRIEAGQGYAGPAVAGNDLVLYDRFGDNDRVRLINLESGKEAWRRELKAGYRDGIDADKGPRSVPTMLPSAILVYSAAGDLALLSRKDGSILWNRGLRKEYKAEDGYFGAGSTPLVFGNQAIVNIGAKSASVVSVAIADGKTIWTSSDAEASYASPIILLPSRDSAVTSPVVVVPAKMKTLGLDVTNGKLLWEFPFGQRGPTVNAATPVLTHAGDIFMTSSYGIGSRLVRPTQKSVAIVSKGTDLSSQYSSPIVIGDRIFGSDGREDGGEGTYQCLQATDGKLLWKQEQMPISHTIGAGGRLLIIGIDGKLWALESEESQFKPLWKSSLPAGKYRALPAFSGNRLYTRSSNGSGDAWYCFQIGTSSSR